MNNIYIKELIEKLEMTEFQNVRKASINSYDEGIKELLHLFLQHKKYNTQLFFIGNGGSSAIASHMTADYMKNGGMNTYGLYDNAVITCMGNDYGYEYVFSKQLGFLIKEGDLLVAISSSGNSPNIINAIEVAKSKKAEVITLTGFKEDNKAKSLGDYNVYIPCEKYGTVESIHNLILQHIVDMLLEQDKVAI